MTIYLRKCAAIKQTSLCIRPVARLIYKMSRKRLGERTKLPSQHGNGQSVDSGSEGRMYVRVRGHGKPHGERD